MRDCGCSPNIEFAIYLASLDAYRLKMMLYYEIPDFEEAFMEIDSRGRSYESFAA